MSEPTRIGDILVRRELVDLHVLRRALSEQPGKGQRLVSMLINQKLIELDEGALALSELSGYPAVLERHFEGRSSALADEIALDLCIKWAVIPLAHTSDGTLVVCARDPSPMLAHALREALEVPIALAIGPALYVEKVIRAICKAPPDSAPAFLPAQIDLPPPGWHRRTVSELITAPPGVDDGCDDRGSKPALLVSTLSSEAPPPPLFSGSSSGIGVPPSDPASLIPDPAIPDPDPAAVPMSYVPETPSARARRSIEIPRVTDPLPAITPIEDIRSAAPSTPPPFGASRTSTGSSAFAAQATITTGSGGTLPPPIADATLVRRPEIVAQPQITTASSIGIVPPQLQAAMREIERALSRANADRLVVDHAATRWKSILLVNIVGETVRGNCGEGTRLTNVANLTLAFAACPLLRAARDTWEMTMTTSHGTLHDPLLDIIGLPAATVPIFVDDTPLAILAVGEPIGELSSAMEELAQLATALGGAYHRFR